LLDANKRQHQLHKKSSVQLVQMKIGEFQGFFPRTTYPHIALQDLDTPKNSLRCSTRSTPAQNQEELSKKLLNCSQESEKCLQST